MPSRKGDGPGSPGPTTQTRIHGAPRLVGPVWTLTEREKERFDRCHGVTDTLAGLPHPHEQDRELYFNGLAAALAFHELSKLIDQVEFDDDVDLEDLHDDLKMVRVGFELALQALDTALGDRAQHLGRAKLGGLARAAKDPKTQAMNGPVREEFERWQNGAVKYRSTAAFARAMLDRFEVLDSQGAIENRCKKWREERKHRTG